MKEDPDGVLESSPADDRLCRGQEQDVSVKVVLNQYDRVWRNAEVGFNL